MYLLECSTVGSLNECECKIYSIWLRRRLKKAKYMQKKKNQTQNESYGPASGKLH